MGGAVASERYVANPAHQSVKEGKWVSLTSEIFGSKGDIPDRQDDRGDEPNDRLRHDYQPSGLEVIRYESPAPYHDNRDRTSAYRQLFSRAGTHQ
jgi:hypothetical protein